MGDKTLPKTPASLLDKSDRKALNNLVGKLFPNLGMDVPKQEKRIKRTKSPLPNSSKKVVNLRNKIRKKPDDVSQQKSMSKWLSTGRCSQNKKEKTSKYFNKDSNKSIHKENKKHISSEKREKSKAKSRHRINDKNDAKRKPLPIIQEKKKPKLTRTKSFDKYGVVLPSIDEVLAKEEEYNNKYNKTVKALLETCDNDISQESLPCISSLTSPELKLKNQLHCKNVAIDDIEKYFNSHMQILTNIMNEKQDCDRHKKYCSQNYDPDLKGSPSMLVFNQQQKTKMIDLMHNKFDPDDISRNYFFQVLLPELCYLIFMDVHGMDRTSAEEYLEKSSDFPSYSL